MLVGDNVVAVVVSVVVWEDVPVVVVRVTCEVVTVVVGVAVAVVVLEVDLVTVWELVADVVTDVVGVVDFNAHLRSEVAVPETDSYSMELQTVKFLQVRSIPSATCGLGAPDSY